MFKACLCSSLTGEIVLYRWIAKNNMKYKPGLFIKYGIVDHMHTFQKIVHIISDMENTVYIVCQLFVSSYFNRHLSAYCITETSQYSLCDLNDFDPAFVPTITMLKNHELFIVN